MREAAARAAAEKAAMADASTLVCVDHRAVEENMVACDSILVKLSARVLCALLVPSAGSITYCYYYYCYYYYYYYYYAPWSIPPSGVAREPSCPGGALSYLLPVSCCS